MRKKNTGASAIVHYGQYFVLLKLLPTNSLVKIMDLLPLLPRIIRGYWITLSVNDKQQGQMVVLPNIELFKQLLGLAFIHEFSGNLYFCYANVL
jgi:hypothetical protein